VVVAVLWGLAQQGEIKPETVAEAIAHYGIDAERADPRAADL
jgi:pyruvate dehydrogenase complex dehydrogenase (E1) component